MRNSEKGCTKCEAVKPISEFYPRKTGRIPHSPACKECLRAQMRQYSKQKGIPQYELLRKNALNKLGGSCRHCGFDNPLALQVDHIKPLLRSSQKRQRDSHQTGKVVYLAVVNGSIGADEVQLLCANCHAIKTNSDKKYFKRKKAYTITDKPDSQTTTV